MPKQLLTALRYSGLFLGIALALPWLSVMIYLCAVVGPKEGWLSDHFLNLEDVSFFLLIGFIGGPPFGMFLWDVIGRRIKQ